MSRLANSSGRRRLAVPAVLVAAIALIPAGDAVADTSPAGSRGAGPPADFVALTDDTGALTISVPSAWADIDTAPGTNDDGTVMQWISASTDRSVYRETFEVPGLMFIGVTYTTDLQSWVDRLGAPAACAASSSEEYDDGAFVGIATTFEQCGATGAASQLVVAANVGDDTTRTYVLQMKAPTAADAAVFVPILNSFHAIGITVALDEDEADEPVPAAAPAPAPEQPTAATPITLPDGTPLVPATAPGQEGPAPAPSPDTGPFTPSNSIAEGAVQVTDDTRTITMAVPPDWVEAATGSSPEGLPQILAGPQLAGFAPGGVAGQTFTVAGARFVARPFTADTAAAVTAAASGLPCTSGTVQQYEDPIFTGHILQLTDCGGTTTRAYLIEASPADSSLTASLLIQVTDFDDGDLQTVLSSFDVARETAPGSGPTATTVAGPTTAVPPTTVAVAPVTTATAPTTAAVPTTVAVPTTAAGAPTSVATPTGVFSPSVDVPPGMVSVIDDTGFLRVGVPPAWVGRRTTPVVGADGVSYPYIAAAADVDLFLQSADGTPNPDGGSGVVYIGVAFTADTAAMLGGTTAGHGCTQGPVQQYTDSVFTGHIQELTACAGTQTRRYVVVATPADGRFTAVVTVQVTDDPSVLNGVLATFTYEPAATAPGEPG